MTRKASRSETGGSPTLGCSIDECKSVFVSWFWAVSILVVIIGVAVRFSWVSATEVSLVKNRIQDHEIRIYKIEGMSRDLDSLKLWVRPK